METLTGLEAKNQLDKILKDSNKNEKYKYPSKGYFRKEEYYTAFDNTTGDCWVETFDNKSDVINWLDRKFEKPQELTVKYRVIDKRFNLVSEELDNYEKAFLYIETEYRSAFRISESFEEYFEKFIILPILKEKENES